jgi:hypothetical protein
MKFHSNLKTHNLRKINGKIVFFFVLGKSVRDLRISINSLLIKPIKFFRVNYIIGS